MTNYKVLKIGIITLLFLISCLPIFSNYCRAENIEIYVKESYFGTSDGTAEKPYTTKRGIPHGMGAEGKGIYLHHEGGGA